MTRDVKVGWTKSERDVAVRQAENDQRRGGRAV